MTWTEIGFTIETPTFLAADGDQRAEFRLPSLKGAARYWFRALAAPVFDDDFREVAKAEAEVFGTAAEDQRHRSNDSGPAPVLFRPISLPVVPTDREPGWLRQKGNSHRKGIAYLLGPGLYKYPTSLHRPTYLPPDYTGRFAVKTSSNNVAKTAKTSSNYAAELTTISLWALATFGGMGARKSRGFGGLSFQGLEQLSSAVDSKSEIDRNHPAIQRLHELLAERWKRKMPEERTSTSTYPDAPSWSRWEIRFGSQTGSWVQLLDEAGLRLREFRAPVDRTQPPLSMSGLEDHRRWASREYVDIIFPRAGARPPDPADFELAAFGLPIVFAHDAVVNLEETNPGRRSTELRRASPLWIRPVRQSSASFRLVFHVFEARIAPPNGQLTLKVGNRPKGPHLRLDEATAYRKIGNFLDEVAP